MSDVKVDGKTKICEQCTKDVWEKDFKINPLVILDSDSDRKYFGGNQEWYESNTMAFAGCGTVACANMLRMLFATRKDVDLSVAKSKELDPLFKREIYKDEYLELMKKIYRSMTVYEFPVIRKLYDRKKRGKKVMGFIPPSFGMSLSGYILGVLSFARKNGLLLHSNALATSWCDYDKALLFIEQGLRESGAVTILTSRNRHPLRLYNAGVTELKKGYDTVGMKGHFATITGIDTDSDGRKRIVLSTWGRVGTVAFDDLYLSWQRRCAYTSCLFYFVPTRSNAVVRSDKFAAIFLLLKAYVRGLLKIKL